jgi:adenosylhomocysteine nucleosidase
LRRIGIVAALATEARALCRRPPLDGTTLTLADGTLLAVSGVGFEAAAQAAAALTHAGVDGLVSFGLAGGLDPALEAGHLLLPDQVVSDDVPALAVDAMWRARLLQALSSMMTISGGMLWSGRQPVLTVTDKRRLFTQWGARAVDMEAMAVGMAAQNAHIAFLAVKVVVDTASDVLPSAVMAADGYGRIRPARLLAALLRHPGQIAALIQLAARYRPASRALRAVAGVNALRQALPA